MIRRIRKKKKKHIGPPRYRRVICPDCEGTTWRERIEYIQMGGKKGLQEFRYQESCSYCKNGIQDQCRHLISDLKFDATVWIVTLVGLIPFTVLMYMVYTYGKDSVPIWLKVPGALSSLFLALLILAIMLIPDIIGNILEFRKWRNLGYSPDAIDYLEEKERQTEALAIMLMEEGAQEDEYPLRELLNNGTKH